MKFWNYKKVSHIEVKQWLKETVPELTEYQKENMYEFINSKYRVYKKRESHSNFWFRLTIIVFFILYLLMFIGLPFNFLFTGSWGYSNIKWFTNWAHKLGL